MQNEELENDFIEDEQDFIEDENEEVEDDQPAESESDSEGDHEEKAATQTKVEERIGELTRKRKESEKLAEQRLAEIQKLQSQIINSQEPVVPDLPDPDEISDSEFKRAITARDKAITDRHAWQQQKQQFDQQQQSYSQQTKQQEMQNLQTAAQTYTARAAKLGVTQEELAKASQVISQVGLSNELAMHILNDEKGAAITRYLGNNIADLLEIANTDSIRAALYIEQKIKPKLTPSKRKSKTPAPSQRVKGGTPDRKAKYPLTGGAKFE
jgi:hypothetical protein